MAYYDEAQKKWIWEDQPKGTPDPMAPGAAALPSYFQRRQQEEQQALLSQDEQARKEFQSKPARPLIAKDLGQFGSEFAKILGNSVEALGTDTVDLGLGLVDVARAAAAPVTGDDFRWNQVFEDSDNPWTKWRRERYRMETELGQAASNLVRIGTAFALFPKMAGRALIGGAAKGAAVAEDVGKVASKGRQIATAVGRLLEPMKPEAVTAALKTVRATELTSRAGKRAGRIAQGDEYLYATLRDYNRAARGAAKVNDAGKAEVLAGTVDRWTALKVAAGKYTPNADKIKNFAQFAAWDAFVAFNIAGEGDYTMDETFGDMLEDSNNPYLRGIGRLTGTTAEMGALEVKGKQMLEGLVLGGVIESAFHYYRISRYVNAFQKATPTERAAIISAFEGEAENIGVGISRSMGETDNIFSRAVPAPKAKPGPGVITPGQPTNAELKAQFLAGRPPVEPQPTTQLQQILSTLERMRLKGDPNEPPGAIVPAPSAGQLVERAAPIGPVQEALRRMGSRGVLQAPGEQAAQPTSEELRAAFNAAMEAAGRTDGGDEEAYQQWLVSNFGRELGGPLGQAIPPGQLEAPDIFPVRVSEPAPGAGKEAPVTGGAPESIARTGIEPVEVKVLGEPIVTPQTYRAGFAQDALRTAKEAWKMRDLVYREGAGGNLQQIYKDVKALAPTNRLSAIELMNQIGVRLNDAGMQNAADSMMTNFIQERGLREGWITIDPDTFTMSVRQDIASDLDVGDAAVRQADALEASMVPGMEGVDLDPVLVDEAMREAAQADALDAKAGQELARVLAGPKDQLSDEEAVRVAFGSGIDRLYVAPVVEKLADRPGFGVYGPDGELLKTFTSQRGADAYVKKVVISERQGFVDRARAMNAQAQPVELAMKYGSPYLDSDVVGKVKITSGQARALQALFMSEAAKPVIDRIVGAVWTPGMFRGIDDLMTMEKGSRMIEMSQSQMSQIVEGVTKAAASGEITTSQRTALNNMVQRLQETAELLEPEAIAKRDVQNILDAIATLSKTGEFCGVV